MGVDKVALTAKSWDLPLAAIFCIAIALYVLLIVIGLSIRQCLLRKGICGGQCPYVPCCNCAELGLHCAQACCNCGTMPTCASLLDHCCPADQGCSCLPLDSCSSCAVCEQCSCEEWCTAPALCSPGPLCDCNSCSCACTTPECSTINCLCCEVTIKGRAPPTPA